jgi:uncharacterized protein
MDKCNLYNGEYVYLPENNVLINSAFLDTFKRYEKKHRVTVIDKKYTKSSIKEAVTGLEKVLFEVTQQCNLRCKYCVYGGGYLYRRNHTTGAMSFETAKKAIDYIYNIIKHRKKREIYFGFYGGEPLLNFKLIKKIVRYINEKFRHFNSSFYMTTNGTLLDEEKIDFFVENSFHLSISLDSGKSQNDSKRVFANGAGTFDTITEKLKMVKARSAEYLKNEVEILSTFSPDLSALERYKFFTEDSFINQLQYSGSIVGTRNALNFDNLEYNRESNKKDIKTIFRKIKQRLLKGEDLFPIEREMLKPFRLMEDTLKSRNIGIPIGTCLFNNRVFVDTSGIFHICEKINNRFPIGDISHGFNFERCAEILNEYILLTQKKCLNCFARLFCKLCFASINGDGKFEISDRFCENEKKKIIYWFEKYIDLKKEEII